jgi:hypothetical protein
MICSESDIAIYYMLSTPFEHNIYLGFSSEQPLEPVNIEATFLGGQPLFLREPSKGQLLCDNCPNQSLTFICQVFCPLELAHSYNRILYVLYCEKCLRSFRCLKQQSAQN